MDYQSHLHPGALAQPLCVPQAQASPSLDSLTHHLEEQVASLSESLPSKTKHTVLRSLLPHIAPVDFRLEAALDSDREQLKQKHHVVTIVRKVRELADQQGFGLCQYNQAVYAYNGAYWEAIEKDELRLFLSEAAERMGLKTCDARYHLFKEQLLAQFLSDGYQAAPELPTGVVKVNLTNGTLVITPEGQHHQAFDPADFLTHQLPYAHDPMATAPRFHQFLARVQPDLDCQRVLAEFIAYLFVATSTLKLEKALILLGSGANGKSVFYEIIMALLGEANTTSYSLQSLTDGRAYYRANLVGKLVNYVSELSGKLDPNAFKQLISGEPIEARLPYGQPFVMKNYAKFIANCNELPTDVEQTDAYFRRFLVIPFEVTIPEAERDPQLATKIIASELPGILNWVLEGLQRLLAQQGFTPCEAAKRQVEDFQKQSDSVRLFMDEEGYQADPEQSIMLSELYNRYKGYCSDGMYTPVNLKNFSKRLKRHRFPIKRKGAGMAVQVVRNTTWSH